MSMGKRPRPYATPQGGYFAALLQTLGDYWYIFLILLVVVFFLGWLARGLFGS
jgi:hypothetical protein